MRDRRPRVARCLVPHPRVRHCPGSQYWRPAVVCGRKPSARRAPNRRFALSSFKTLRKPSLLTVTIPCPADAVAAAHAADGERPSRVAGRGVALRRAAAAALAAAALVLVLVPGAPAPASASTTSLRLTALQWAERQAGKRYCWGGSGPACFDCSGLVVAAYAHAGIRLPRTTYAIMTSGKLRRIPASSRRRGDLAFYGSGHVELVTSRGTFGALEPGTRVGWHRPSRWWHPTVYLRVR